MPSFIFLDFPLELQLKIIYSAHSYSDKLSLISTCSKLYNAFYYDIVIELVRRHAGKKAYGFLKKVEPEGGKHELDAFRPIVFGPTTSKINGKLIVNIVCPNFLVKTDEYQPGDVLVEMDDVFVHENENKKYIENLEQNAIPLDWETHCRGNLVKMTGHLLRKHNECPECGGSRCICPGCGGVGERWPDLFTSCGWGMPCPCCIGYGTAYDSKYIQDEEEELEALWKKIDEIM
ncbi:hypothetical protein Moror_2420 [Moniliophthora roreri MCA 2997]|uniref:Uncharacterized protein n=2 Tax=Moniliophthora roreri TaxID=221103 RepID=V2WG19_MONRO|nr:hypothetical protein Moror_2420 [Moniliophthora roreri MCA 2997]KAI3605438.1 hypothetical protein WG66_005900 [Moniliophthora roreri]